MNLEMFGLQRMVEEIKMMKINRAQNYLNNYYRELTETIKKIDQKQLGGVETLLQQTKDKGKIVYLIGNGGSASTCDHICNDFTKIAGIKTISLTNIPIITAFANDVSYDSIFEEQLKLLLNPKDTLIGITGSGNSPNINNGFRFAKNREHTLLVF